MHEYTSRVRTWELTCPGSPAEVGRARRWTRHILRDAPCADDAALIVAELGANALLHTASGDIGGAFYVTVHATNETVSISVTDHGGTRATPQVEHAGDDATHGRGLAIVTALASRVETHGDQHSHTVTAHLTYGKDET
jgi:anti-sigma regulatory factor (Ser/Thr protein kinase)